MFKKKTDSDSGFSRAPRITVPQLSHFTYNKTYVFTSVPQERWEELQRKTRARGPKGPGLELN